jgi:hypothetical protein
MELRDIAPRRDASSECHEVALLQRGKRRGLRLLRGRSGRHRLSNQSVATLVGASGQAVFRLVADSLPLR